MRMKYRRGFLQSIRKNILHKEGGVDFTQYPSYFYDPLFHSTDIVFEGKTILEITYRIRKHIDFNKKALYPMIACYVCDHVELEVIIPLPLKLARRLYKKDIIWIKEVLANMKETPKAKFIFNFENITE